MKSTKPILDLPGQDAAVLAVDPKGRLCAACRGDGRSGERDEEPEGRKRAKAAKQATTPRTAPRSFAVPVPSSN